MGLDNGGDTVAIIGSDETKCSIREVGPVDVDFLWRPKSHRRHTNAGVAFGAGQRPLFRHSNTGHWASYRGVQSGSGSLVDLISSYPQSTCWNVQQGFALSAGTLTATAGLCDTDLYFQSSGSGGDGGMLVRERRLRTRMECRNRRNLSFQRPWRQRLPRSQINFPHTESNALGFVKGLGFSGGRFRSTSDEQSVETERSKGRKNAMTDPPEACLAVPLSDLQPAHDSPSASRTKEPAGISD